MKKFRPISSDRLPEELRQLVANVMDKDEQDLALDADLVNDLGLDSVMRLEVLVSLERTYGVKIAQEDLVRLTSINDACQLLLDKQASTAAV